MQINLSTVELVDFANDVITSINNVSVAQLTATQMAQAYPHLFFIEKNPFGIDRLCAARIDGQEFSVTAVTSNTPYVPTVTDYDTMVKIKGLFSAHPIHRPK
jgi:hypothetical protein